MGLWAGGWSPGQGSQSSFPEEAPSQCPEMVGLGVRGQERILVGVQLCVCVCVCVPDYTTCVRASVLITLCLHRCC